MSVQIYKDVWWTKMKIWKETRPVKEEQLFPAL